MIAVTESILNENTPRVLLVEDDSLVNKIHRRELEMLKCIVDSAFTGKDALTMYKNRYDLILMDYGLPDLTGIEVCEKIREYEKFHKLPRVPIVMITAYCQTVELQKQCFNAGIDKFLTKPIVDKNIWKSLLAEAMR